MLFRVRRFVAVILSLALLPAAAGGAQCASHETGGVVAAEDAGLSVADGQSRAHSSHAHHGAAGELALAERNEGHADHAAPVDANRADSHDGSQTAAGSAPQNCCPPTSVPGACSSAMGCGVVSAAQAVSGTDASLANSSVTASPGSVLPPGPSRAPDVPPPRA